MRHRIARFAPHRTALAVGVVYAGVLLVVVVALGIISAVGAQTAVGPGHMGGPGPMGGPGHGVGYVMQVVLAPLFGFVFGYVASWIGCVIYNAAAPKIGGVEMDLEAVGD